VRQREKEGEMQFRELVPERGRGCIKANRTSSRTLFKSDVNYERFRWVDGPTGSFGRMTASSRIYGTPVAGFSSIDKSAILPFFLLLLHSPSRPPRIRGSTVTRGEDTLRPVRWRELIPGASAVSSA